MQIILLLFLIVLNCGFLVLTLLTLPGNWLMIIATALFAWWKWDAGIFSIWTLIFICVLALIGELIEFFAGAGGAKKSGASWLGSLGAIPGAIFGGLVATFAIPVPVVGTILGACSGAAIGTILMESLCGKKIHETTRYGLGAGIGVFIGITSKFALGVLIWLIIAVAAFVP